MCVHEFEGIHSGELYFVEDIWASAASRHKCIFWICTKRRDSMQQAFFHRLKYFSDRLLDFIFLVAAKHSQLSF